MTRWLAIVAGVMMSNVVVLPLAACTLGGDLATERRIESEHYRLVFRATPAVLRSGTPFGLEIRVCPVAGAPLPHRLVVDATMPAHNHGMNYRPTVQPSRPGNWRAEGFLLHMPGRWQFAFELKDATETTLLTLDIDVP